MSSMIITQHSKKENKNLSETDKKFFIKARRIARESSKLIEKSHEVD